MDWERVAEHLAKEAARLREDARSAPINDPTGYRETVSVANICTILVKAIRAGLPSEVASDTDAELEATADFTTANILRFNLDDLEGRPSGYIDVSRDVGNAHASKHVVVIYYPHVKALRKPRRFKVLYALAMDDCVTSRFRVEAL